MLHRSNLGESSYKDANKHHATFVHAVCALLNYLPVLLSLFLLPVFYLFLFSGIKYVSRILPLHALVYNVMLLLLEPSR